MWYKNSIGKTYGVVRYYKDEGVYLVFADDGFLNIVRESDVTMTTNFEDYQEKTGTFMMPTSKNPSYLFSGIAGEVGELCSLYAKSVRDGMKPDFGVNLLKELGDVQFFVSEIAKYYGISLADVADKNIEKLTDRQKRGVVGGSGDNR